MDWNHFKEHEIEEDRRGNGTNTFGFVHSNFSVDLKLGRQVVSPIEPKMTFSPSGSSKRKTRAVVNNGVQTACCLVDGCTADLSNCREYHRRHKVCEVHSKTPEVTISGHKRRFCQQCSRFHSLGEFDEGKRSCRKRLDGHNRRRRKPPPESSSHHRPLTFFSPGNRMFPFSTTDHIFTTAAMNQNHPTTWPPEGFRIDPFSVSSLSSSSTPSLREEGGGKQQPQHCNTTNVFSGNQTIIFNESPPKYLYDDGSSQILGSSNRALSLLSSPPSHHHHHHRQQQTSDIIGFNPSNLQHYGDLNNNNNNNNNMRMESSVMNYLTMFQDSSSAETPQTLPFYWRDG